MHVNLALRCTRKAYLLSHAVPRQKHTSLGCNWQHEAASPLNTTFLSTLWRREVSFTAFMLRSEGGDKYCGAKVLYCALFDRRLLLAGTENSNLEFNFSVFVFFLILFFLLIVFCAGFPLSSENNEQRDL